MRLTEDPRDAARATQRLAGCTGAVYDTADASIPTEATAIRALTATATVAATQRTAELCRARAAENVLTPPPLRRPSSQPCLYHSHSARGAALRSNREQQHAAGWVGGRVRLGWALSAGVVVLLVVGVCVCVRVLKWATGSFSTHRHAFARIRSRASALSRTQHTHLHPNLLGSAGSGRYSVYCTTWGGIDGGRLHAGCFLVGGA